MIPLPTQIAILPHARAWRQAGAIDRTLQGCLEIPAKRREKALRVRAVCAVLAGLVVPRVFRPGGKPADEIDRLSEWLLLNAALPSRAEETAAVDAMRFVLEQDARRLDVWSRAFAYREMWRLPEGREHLALLDAGMMCGMGFDLVMRAYPESDREAMALALHGLRTCDELARAKGAAPRSPEDIDRGLALSLVGVGSAARDAWSLRTAEAEARKEAAK